MVGKTTGAISTYERGTAEPTAGVVVKLAEALDVSVDDLLNKDLTQEQINAEAPKRDLEKYARDLTLFPYTTLFR